MDLENIVADLIQKVERRFYGKYRGFVVDNADPEHLGRLKLNVPSVLGSTVVTGWAMPCVPYGGEADQGFLFIPETGAGVWVEFEEGDLEFPIWSGAFWSKPKGNSELPKPNKAAGSEESNVQDPPTRKIIKTRKGHTIQFEDADGNEMITLVDGVNGHVITLDSGGIIVEDGKNSGNKVVMEATGVTVADKNGNSVVLGPGGIQIGSGNAIEPLVLGAQLTTSVGTFLASLKTHTHLGNLGTPTSPPQAPIDLKVPLSSKHTTE